MPEVYTPARLAIPASESLTDGPEHLERSISLRLLESSHGATFLERLIGPGEAWLSFYQYTTQMESARFQLCPPLRPDRIQFGYA